MHGDESAPYLGKRLGRRDFLRAAAGGASGLLVPLSALGAGDQVHDLPPDFIVVSIPSGYPVTPHIRLLPMDPIPLRPTVRVPYGGL